MILEVGNVATPLLSGEEQQDLSPVLSPEDRLHELLEFPDTDAGNAEAFALLHGDRFRYDHSKGKWLLWNRRYWAADETNAAARAALATIRARRTAAASLTEAWRADERIKWALKGESISRRRALLESARSIKSLATTGSDYDCDQLLLTVGNGTLDLRTGTLRECRPEDLISHATDVLYDAYASCPRWLQFLDEIFGGNQEVIDFIWRAIGYTLTGDTQEQCLFVLYGLGANGKSTFLEVLLRLVGSHGVTTPFSTFLLQQNPGAPRNDLAALKGTRLVKAAESEQYGALDEAMLKLVTGGDTVSARFLYQEFFQYKPEFKIWLATNHKPKIRGTEEAIWRRFRLIPFEKEFKGKKRDARLMEKLTAELPGIMAWAVKGCLAWRRDGLGNPTAINQATLQYRQESDQLGRFVEQKCSLGPEYQAGAKHLYEAYLEWCRESGEKPKPNNKFATMLEEREIDKRRTNQGVVYYGIALGS